jgi:hypothetical protein
MTIDVGVYLDSNNYNALVFKADADTVYFVARLSDKDGFDVHAMGVQAFVKRFWSQLPNYPMRRCARVYRDSLFDKSALATKVLNHLLRS